MEHNRFFPLPLYDNKPTIIYRINFRNDSGIEQMIFAYFIDIIIYNSGVLINYCDGVAARDRIPCMEFPARAYPLRECRDVFGCSAGGGK